MKNSVLFAAITITIYFAGCESSYQSLDSSSGYYSSIPSDEKSRLFRGMNECSKRVSDLCDQQKFDEAYERCKRSRMVYNNSRYPELAEGYAQMQYMILTLHRNYLLKTQQSYKGIPIARRAINECFECDNHDYSLGYMMLAIFLDRVDRIEEAVDSIKSAIRYDPDIAAPYILWGRFVIRLGNKEEARDILQRAIKIDPKNSAVYRDIGKLYLEMNDYPKAIEALEQCLTLDPNTPSAKDYLELSYEAQNTQE